MKRRRKKLVLKIFSLWQDADWHYQTNTYLKNCTP